MTDAVARLTAALEGRYRIERELGEGGTATVYLAEDLKHNRKVAIKVLKPELAAMLGAERFLQEIATTAHLQHPNILPLFDSGEADSFLFYVMPYVEGATLQERMDRERQLPVDEAVHIALAVADALDFAHGHGVVHRDIKPDNILFQAGQPMVGDFGIALAVGAAGGARLTKTGGILGTPDYMSPEQATGDPRVGPATDIYALGCVLYEMLVGTPPYTGTTAQAVLGQIFATDVVPARERRSSVPAHVDAVIRRALEKLPADRFASAQDFGRALTDESFRHGGAAGSVDPAAAKRAKWVGGVGWSLVAALAIALALVLTRPNPVPKVGRFAIPEDERMAFSDWGRILHDGSGMVWIAPNGSQWQIWVRHWDERAGTPVRGTEGVTNLNIAPSPDGTEVSFSTGGPGVGALKVASLLGGPVRTIVDSAWGAGVWSPDGKFIYYNDADMGITRIRSVGGEKTVVVKGQRGDSAWFPEALVPGRDVLMVSHFVPHRADAKIEIRAVDLRTGEIHSIAEGTPPVFVTKRGRLVFGTRNGALMVTTLDPDALKVTAPATLMLEGVADAGGTRHMLMASVSDNGSLLYLPVSTPGEATPVWVDRNGRTQVMDPEWHFRWNIFSSGVALSPDGTRVAVTEYDGTAWNVYVKELDAGPRTRITALQGRRAVWSADGRTVYFLSGRADGVTGDIWARPADGSRPPYSVLDRKESINEAFPVGDGSFVFRTGTINSGRDDADLFLWDARRDTVTTLVNSDFIDWEPTLSPNGKWLAYTSNESGRYQVYVRPFPDTKSWRRQISIDGGSSPLWSRDGTELFYEDSTSVWSASVQTSPTFVVKGRTRLFATASLAVGTGHRLYDVSPDGKRFAMLSPGQAKPSALILVKNWLSQVDKRLRR